MPTDAELLARYAGTADPAAFTELARRHGAFVYRVCLRRLGDVHEAEDAAQAVFLVLSRRAGTIRKAADLATWL